MTVVTLWVVVSVTKAELGGSTVISLIIQVEDPVEAGKLACDISPMCEGFLSKYVYVSQGMRVSGAKCLKGNDHLKRGYLPGVRVSEYGLSETVVGRVILVATLEV